MKSTRKSVSVWTVFIMAMTLFLVGCNQAPPSSLTSTAPASASIPQVVSVSIVPSETGARFGGTINFSAVVLNARDANSTWSIAEGSAGGTISSTGVYTAPTSGGLFHVVATSIQDPTKSATATVNVTQVGFSPVGPLGTARMMHTATLLPNGKVLVAGGGQVSYFYDDWDTDAVNVEVFDPAAGSFTLAGKMAQVNHTATLLSNGDVLLAGGQSYANLVTAGAERMNAATGTIDPTGKLLIARENHSATLLQDGRVLITGGGGLVPPGTGTTWTLLDQTEFYTPSTGTFSAGPALNVARDSHTSTLLPNGTVLVAGGDAGSTISIKASNAAEIYDPTTNSFKNTLNMTTARAHHTATLLPNGKVLITGGGTSTAELYDPVTGSFTATGNMSIQRSWHTATLLNDGTVLIAGGLTLGAKSTATTEIYNPATGTFTSGATMGHGRFQHTATLLQDGRVLIAGGGSSVDGNHIVDLSDAEVYY